jgi:hypothetical protein
MKQNIELENGKAIEVEVSTKGNAVTVSQQAIEDGVRAKTVNCTVTCYEGSKSYSHSWTCSDGQNCSGDCSTPSSPKGSCY